MLANGVLDNLLLNTRIGDIDPGIILLGPPDEAVPFFIDLVALFGEDSVGDEDLLDFGRSGL